MNQLPDLKGMFVMLGVMCAIAGWALINGLIWIASHLSWTWS